MKLSIISFTQRGIRLSERLSEKLDAQVFTKCKPQKEKWAEEKREEWQEQVSFVEESIANWAGEQMEQRNALLFIGACGIAVRAIAPHVNDKLQDSPVLVMDEKGRYVIPILSGHMGGANELALVIAKEMGAEPVLTTATDINHKFAVDLFAKKNGLFPVNRDGIAKVSAKVLEGERLTIAVEPGHIGAECRLPEDLQLVAYPPLMPADIVVTAEKGDFDAAILLRPREYVIGMGCKKGKEAEKIEAFILQTIKRMGISSTQVRALASVDVKAEEKGLLAWCRKERIPFLTYTPEELQRVEGELHTSDFVREKVGVDNVCERAALCACGPGGRLVYEKHAEDGMTIAIAQREWRICFDET